MNLIVIPAILAVIVMVAGMFAFMPVEQASTVHDTVIEALEDSLDAQDEILYFTWTTGGDEFESELPLVPLVENGYSGTVNVLGNSPPIFETDNDDGTSTEQSCIADFDVDADTGNDGVSDTNVASADIVNNSVFESAAIPDGTDQLFLDTSGLDSNDICSISVTIFLEGTNT